MIFVPRIYEFSRLGEKQSGKPFRLSSPGYTLPFPRRTPEVNYFSDYGRKESYIDLQFTAVRRQRRSA